jgi:hypothetical protein
MLLQYEMRLQRAADSGRATRCAAWRDCDLPFPGQQQKHLSDLNSHMPLQEGRGTGIAAKIRAYFLQTMAECDTVEGLALGYNDDGLHQVFDKKLGILIQLRFINGLTHCCSWASARSS